MYSIAADIYGTANMRLWHESSARFRLGPPQPLFWVRAAILKITFVAVLGFAGALSATTREGFVADGVVYAIGMAVGGRGASMRCG